MNTFISYITFVLIALLANVRKIKNTYSARIFLIITIIISSIIIRYNGVQFDLIVYEQLMKETGWNLYFIREFMFHAGIRFIYFITNSTTATFIIIDFITSYLIIIILKNKNVSISYIFMILLSFSFLIGFFNIYRQHLATILFAFAMYSKNVSGDKRSCLFVVLSVFTHNLMFYFLPIFVSERLRGAKKKVFSSIILIIICIPILLGFDRDVVLDGSDNSLYYLYYVLTLSFFNIVLLKKLGGDYWNVVLIILLSLIAFINFSYNGAERVLISSITFLIFECVFALNKINQKFAILNLGFVCVFTGPFVVSGIYKNML